MTRVYKAGYFHLSKFAKLFSHTDVHGLATPLHPRLLWEGSLGNRLKTVYIGEMLTPTCMWVMHRHSKFSVWNLSNMVNPLSSIAGTALLGFAAAKPALVKVSPIRENQDGVHDIKNCFMLFNTLCFCFALLNKVTKLAASGLLLIMLMLSTVYGMLFSFIKLITERHTGERVSAYSFSPLIVLRSSILVLQITRLFAFTHPLFNSLVRVLAS